MNETQSFSSRVSIVARLVPSFSYAISMAGCALGALQIIRTFQAMRNAETAGIASVAGGVAEASLTTAIILDLGIFVGLIGIAVIVVRSLITTSTASPSGWYFLINGGLSLIPLALLWKAESLLIQAISPGFTGGVVQVATTIGLYLNLTIITAGVFTLISLVSSFVPLPSMIRAKRPYAPVLVVLLMGAALVGTAIAFHLRSSRLYQVGINERF